MLFFENLFLPKYEDPIHLFMITRKDLTRPRRINISAFLTIHQVFEQGRGLLKRSKGKELQS